MAGYGSIVFSGKSGERYRFHAWPLGTRFKPLGGVYFVTRRAFEDRTYHRASHEPVYIGQSANLAEPFATESQLERFRKHGANCICVCAVADEAQRLATEQDLIAGHRTACNE